MFYKNLKSNQPHEKYIIDFFYLRETKVFWIFKQRDDITIHQN